MKLALLGDTHFISPDVPLESRVNRDIFSQTWRSFGRLARELRNEAPDLVVSVGDLVDWFTPESCDFAVALMDELGLSWLMTPGNHDLDGLSLDKDGRSCWQRASNNGIDARAQWAARGVELKNRVIDLGRHRLILLDSAESRVPPGTVKWLDTNLLRFGQNIVCTHVPLDTPEVRRYVLSRSPKRDMQKYVQSGSPELFSQCFKGRGETVFTGHLHLEGELHVEGTAMKLLPLSVMADYKHNGDHIIGRPSATIVEFDRDIAVRRIECE